MKASAPAIRPADHPSATPAIRPSAARLVASLVISGAAFGAAAQQETPGDGVYKDRIDWGVMMDLSGPTSASQGIWTNGFQDYMRKINEAGGVHGRKVNVLAEDSRFNPAQDKINYEKLVGQTPVIGISGLGSSSSQVSLAPTIRSGKVPVLGTYTPTKALNEPVSPMTYSGFCGYKQMAQAGIGHYVDKLKLKNPKIMTVSIESAGGQEYHDYVKDVAAKYGGTAVMTTMKVTAVDATPQVLEVIAAKPDLITIYGVSNTAILTMKGLAQYGSKIPGFGITYLGAPQIFVAMGQQAGDNYAFVSCLTPGGSDNSPGNLELSAYADKVGHGNMKDDVNYVHGWTTAKMAADALINVGAQPTRAKLVEYLSKGFTLDTKGLMAPVTYTPTNHDGPILLKVFDYDYTTKKFKSIGDYSDYAKYTR